MEKDKDWRAGAGPPPVVPAEGGGDTGGVANAGAGDAAKGLGRAILEEEEIDEMMFKPVKPAKK